MQGGGFAGCWLGCAELESLLIAALGRIRVISLDYRQGPDHKFPAASENVAAAYRDLLETYVPENIGLYGSSAGGMLAAQAVAWFQQHDLPRPGAIALMNAGAAPTAALFGGEAGYTSRAICLGRDVSRFFLQCGSPGIPGSLYRGDRFFRAQAGAKINRHSLT